MKRITITIFFFRSCCCSLHRVLLHALLQHLERPACSPFIRNVHFEFNKKRRKFLFSLSCPFICHLYIYISARAVSKRRGIVPAWTVDSRVQSVHKWQSVWMNRQAEKKYVLFIWLVHLLLHATSSPSFCPMSHCIAIASIFRSSRCRLSVPMHSAWLPLPTTPHRH